MESKKWETDIDLVLRGYGITNSPFQEDAAEQLATVLQDYESMAKKHGEMIVHFQQEEKPIHKSGVWCCPRCGKRIKDNHDHCHWCGKKVGWGR